MSAFVLGSIVAERNYEYVNENGDENKIVLRVGSPAPNPLIDGDWYCPYQIVGSPKNTKVGVAYGIDSIQVLLLALQKARIELESIQRSHHLNITWMNHEDWGLPETETAQP